MIEDKEQALKLIQEDAMNLRLLFWDLREDKDLVLEAVKNNPYSIQFASEKLQNDEELLSYVTKNDAYYYNCVDEVSGLRFSIPLLLKSDPTYYDKYVYFMRMKEDSHDTFEKVLSWD